MDEYIIHIFNETSEMLDIKIFQNPPQSPSPSDIAWMILTSKPDSPVITFEVPADIAHHDFHVIVADHPDASKPTVPTMVLINQYYRITGSKGAGYELIGA